MSTIFTLVNMASQNGGTAGQHLAHIFKNNWSNPSFILGHESRHGGMGSKYGDDVVSNMRGRAKHKTSPGILECWNSGMLS